MIRCLHCGAETANGLALCDLCQRFARECLTYLPVYFRNLSRWTPGRAGSRPVPGSRVLWMGEQRDPDQTGDKISDALDEAMTMLVKRAEELADARPYLSRLLDRLSKAQKAGSVNEAQVVAWLCRGFDRWLTSIATLDWCGEFVTVLSQHERRLSELTSTSIPGWYAGACKRCGNATAVVPGLRWTTCQGVTGYIDGDPQRPVRCGLTTHASDHLETILDEAREWVGPPKRIAEAVVALVQSEQSVTRLHDRIRQWEARGTLASFQHIKRDYEWDDDTEQIVVTDQPTGPKRYRLGDVLDMVFRRANDTVVVKAS